MYVLYRIQLRILPYCTRSSPERASQHRDSQMVRNAQPDLYTDVTEWLEPLQLHGATAPIHVNIFQVLDASLRERAHGAYGRLILGSIFNLLKEEDFPC